MNLSTDTYIIRRCCSFLNITNLVAILILLGLSLFGLIFGIYTGLSLEDTTSVSFFDSHSGWFLVGLALFPRITLLLNSAILVALGPLSWIALLLSPKFLVAGIASALYWDTNPILVIISWLISFSSSSSSEDS